MKRKESFFILSILSVLFINLVSAQYSRNSVFSNINLGDGIKTLIDQFTLFVSPIFEVILNDYSSSEFFFAKIMILFLLMIIIHAILTRIDIFNDKRNISLTISLIVSILSVRYLASEDLINFILLPYGTFGAVVASLVPFLIFAYGIHVIGLPGIGRKIAWGFFGIVFGTLWLYNSDKIGDIGNTIYIITSIAIIFMFIFDRRIHAYFRGLDGKKIEESINDERIARLESERAYLTSNPAGGGGQLSESQKRTLRNLDRQINILRRRGRFFS